MDIKKVFFSLILFSLFSLIGYAQIKVLSNGKVGIGTTNPQYGSIEIGKSGVNNGLAIYDSSTNNSALRLYLDGSFGYLNFGNANKGITIKNNGRIGFGYVPNIGWAINEFINVYITPTNPSCAFSAWSDFGADFGDVIKVYSKRHTDVAYVVRDISKGGDEMTFFVNGDGSIYSKGSLLTASDESYKRNINSLNNGLNIIKQIRGVTYELNEQVEKVNATDFITVNNIRNDMSLDTLSASVQSPVPVEIINKIKAEKRRKKVGFIAQEIEEVFPEAVYTLPNGKKAIAYSEIIPLLVEAIKEQQNVIDEMKQSKGYQIRSDMNNNNRESDHSPLIIEKLESKLYSNIPNPFREQTIISYYISENASTASIHIYNLQGKQIKQINIEEKGNSSVVINGYEFTPGMYMYTLIVDGKEIDTKKMILTE